MDKDAVCSFLLRRLFSLVIVWMSTSYLAKYVCSSFFSRQHSGSHTETTFLNHFKPLDPVPLDLIMELWP